MRLDDPARDRESQPCTVAGADAGVAHLEEAIEHVRQLLGRDPVARVGHAHERAFVVRLHAHLHAPAGRREFERVADEVGEQLRDALRIGVHHRQLALVRRLQRDAAALGERAHRVQGGFDEGSRRDVAWRHREPPRLEPRHVEQVLDQRVDLRRRLKHDLHSFRHVRRDVVALPRFGEDASREHLHRARRVAQIVRHDPHHVVARADRLVQRLLGAIARAHVAQHGGVDVLPLDLHALDRRLGGELVSRLAQPRDLLALAHQSRAAVRRAEAVDVPPVRRTEPLREQHREVFPPHLLGRPAEDPLRPFVEEDDPLLLVHGDHRVGGDREEAGEQVRRQDLLHRGTVDCG